MISSPAATTRVHLADGRALHGANVRRLMVRLNMTLADVVAATGLDERTVRSILRGTTRPHARTLHKLAEGLGVDADELFRDPREGAAAFDRRSNPAVAQAIDAHPQLFARWTRAEFEELYSRVAVGGELTEEGALAAAAAMNRRRELLRQVAVILETQEREHLQEFIAMLYRRVTTVEE
ncbi:MAG: helix-turn-helix transcriptional regulator [Pirellulales bacterium]|nr:helix-turn-helix transcriptional regulator [Pirellulales bacterium]